MTSHRTQLFKADQFPHYNHSMISQRIHWHLNIQHFLVDAISVSCLMGNIRNGFDMSRREECIWFVACVVLYNTIAFCTQWLVGFYCDIIDNDWALHPLYAALLLLGVLISFWSPVMGIILIGLGNSLFHIVGGRYVIRHLGECSSRLGLFVAPGAWGVYCGKSFSCLQIVYCILFMINTALVLWFLSKRHQESDNTIAKIKNPELDSKTILSIVGLILVCIICRAASGSVQLPGSKFASSLAWLPVLFVFAGKSMGGFIGDRLGIALTGVVALLAGTLLLTLGECETTFLLGQFFMNILMPLTLFILVKVLPEYPGLAFGLAATVLYPGSLVRIAWNPHLVFSVLSIGSIVCFGLACFLLDASPRKSN